MVWQQLQCAAHFKLSFIFINFTCLQTRHYSKHLRNLQNHNLSGRTTKLYSYIFSWEAFSRHMET